MCTFISPILFSLTNSRLLFYLSLSLSLFPSPSASFQFTKFKKFLLIVRVTATSLFSSSHWVFISIVSVSVSGDV